MAKTIYNKKTVGKSYGDASPFNFALPASLVEGQRGPGVVVDLQKHYAMALDYEKASADLQSNQIEIEDTWDSNPNDPVTRFFYAMIKLKGDRIMRIGGELDHTGAPNPTKYCSIFDPYNPSAGWVSVAPFPGNYWPVSSSACTLHNGDVLVVGAWPTVDGSVSFAGAKQTNSGQAWLYHPGTNTWTQTGAIPEDYIMNTAPLCVLANGKAMALVCTGSGIAFGEFTEGSRKCYVYNPASGTWAATTMGTAHNESALYPIPGGNKAVAVGGISHVTLDEGIFPIAMTRKCEVYDDSTGQWTPLPDMPAIVGEDVVNPETGKFDYQDELGFSGAEDSALHGARAYHSVAVVGRKMYVFGGFGGDLDHFHERSSIISFDFDTNAWTVEPVKLPQGPTDSVYVYDIGGNCLFLASGFDSFAFVDHYRCWVYNYVENTMTPSADLPNVPNPYGEGSTAIQNGFHTQYLSNISINKDFLFFCAAGTYDTENPETGGASALLQISRRPFNSKHRDWDDQTAQQKATARAQNKALMDAGSTTGRK